MKTIFIKDFKAHKDLTIEFNKKSFLLYGDNGAGKSSIYEAIKYKFFKNKMEVAITTNSFHSEADRDAALREFWLQYNNTITTYDFIITINNGTFNLSDYQVSMIQLDDTAFDKYLNLNTLLEKVFFMLPDNFNK